MYALILVIGLVAVKAAQKISDNDIPELHFLDTSVDPCDNFYQFACGNFKNFSNRPEDVETVDLYTITEDELVQVGYEILSSPKLPSDPVALKKVKSGFRACMDTNYTDQLPNSPEQTLIDQFGMPLVTGDTDTKLSWADIGEIVGRTGIQQLFKFSVNNFNPEEYILMILSDTDTWEQPEMIRPQTPKSYDEVLDESFDNVVKKTKFKSRLLSSDPFDTLLQKISANIIRGNVKYTLSDSKLLKDLEDIKNFKAKLLSGGDTSDYIPVDLPYDLTLEQLQNWTDGLEIDMNWVEYVGNIFKRSGIAIDGNQVIYNGLVTVEKIYGILNLVKNTDPSVVKNFILLRTFLYLAPDSSKSNRDAFEKYYRSLGLHYYDRWEYCTRKILDVVDSTSLSFAVAHDYQRYHFNNNKIPKAVKLIRELKEAFRTSVELSDWVDQESRDAVYEKIDNLLVNLAYPDFVDNKNRLDAFYENVEICEWDHYGNSLRTRAFKLAYALSAYTEKNYWNTSPFKVNAFASRQSLSIMMPISMLHDNYFQKNNTVLGYSRLGTTIAHEMTHHFDQNGVKIDQAGNGNSPLISEASLAALNETFDCLKNQYGAYYIPEIDKYVDGKQTLNENFCDNGGLRRSFLAFKRHLGKNDIKKKSGKFTPEQLFFIGYATMWCSDDTAAYLDSLVSFNEHPPNRVRILGPLSNLQEFSDAFDCPVGSKMNREEKCVVW